MDHNFLTPDIGYPVYKNGYAEKPTNYNSEIRFPFNLEAIVK